MAQPQHSTPEKGFTNQQLIPIYTEWVNRCLGKRQLPPIRDLTADIGDAKTLVTVINALTGDCPGASKEKLAAAALSCREPVESIGRCLRYLASIGVNVNAIQPRDIRDGHLVAILSLLYSIWYFKHQQRSRQRSAEGQSSSPQHLPSYSQAQQLHRHASTSQSPPSRKPPSQARMPPQTASKLPSPLRVAAVAQQPQQQQQQSSAVAQQQQQAASGGGAGGGSRIAAPTPVSKLATPKASHRQIPSTNSTIAYGASPAPILPTVPPPPVPTAAKDPTSRARSTSRLKVPESTKHTSLRSSTLNLSASPAHSSGSSANVPASGIAAPKPPKLRITASTPTSLRPTSSLPATQPAQPSITTAVHVVQPKGPPSSDNSQTLNQSDSPQAGSKLMKLKFFGAAKEKRAAELPQAPEKPHAAEEQDATTKVATPKRSSGLRAPKVTLTVTSQETQSSEQKTSTGPSGLKPPSSTTKMLVRRASPQVPRRAAPTTLEVSSSKTSENGDAHNDTDHDGSTSGYSSGYASVAHTNAINSPQQPHKPVLAVKAMVKEPTPKATATLTTNRTSLTEAKPPGRESSVSTPASAANEAKATTNGPSARDAAPVEKPTPILKKPVPREPDKRLSSEDAKRYATNPNEAMAQSSEARGPKNVEEAPSVEEIAPMKPLKIPKMSTSGSCRATEDVKPGAPRTSLDDKDALPSLPLAVAASSNRRSANGYVSEGESLAMPYLHMGGARSGYLSEDGGLIGDGGAKVREQFAAAARYCLRRRRDSCEDSSSVSSGISEHIDDLSTDDLSASSCEQLLTAAGALSHPQFGGAASLRQSSAVAADKLRCETHNRLACSANPDYTSIAGGPHSELTAGSSLCHTYDSSLHGPVGCNAPPQLALSDDGDMLTAQRSGGRCNQLNGTPYANGAPLRHGQLPHDYSSQSLDRHGRLRTFASNAALVSAPSSPFRLSQLPEHMEAAHAPESHYHSAHAHHPSRISGSQSTRSLAPHQVYANPGVPGLHLHKLTPSGIAPNANPCYAAPHNSSDMRGRSASQMPYAVDPVHKYQMEFSGLLRQMDAYRATVSQLVARESGYNSIIRNLDQKLQDMDVQLERLQQNTHFKQGEVDSLRREIDGLRMLSMEAGLRSAAKDRSPPPQDPMRPKTSDMRRHPSLESVMSHQSSMSAASKNTDKASANAFVRSTGNNKKSWIRSSFSRGLFKGKKSKGDTGATSDAEQSPLHGARQPQFAGSINGLNDIGTGMEVVQLKKLVEEKDSALTDVRLDALEKAREAEILRETVTRLKHENNLLRHNNAMLERKIRSCSRASSCHSMSTFEEEHVYATPPLGDHSFASSDTSSKRSSGGFSIRVFLCVDASGNLTFDASTPALCIGTMNPIEAGTTWTDVDQQLGLLLEEYLHRVDPDMTLGVDSFSAIIGYQVGEELIRNRLSANERHPSDEPSDIISSATPIRLRLKGAAQSSLESLVVESLLPLTLLDQMVSLLVHSRRLIIYGGAGIGKSNLARHLVRYLALQLRVGKEHVFEVQLSEDGADAARHARTELESRLKRESQSIVLLDNVHRRNVAAMCNAFEVAGGESEKGPYVVCTINRTSDINVQELQLRHNFRLYLLSHQLDAVKGYIGRYLRRRIVEAELQGHCTCAESLQCVVEFLERVLQIVNKFLEDANVAEKTIGPRTFLQCPLSMETSRTWFIGLWNHELLPYLEKVLRSRATAPKSNAPLKDPTPEVCKLWPWLDGNGGKAVLRRIPEEALHAVQSKEAANGAQN